MTRPVMFLRTAQTESRIEDLEAKMVKVLKHLKLEEPTQSDEEWEKASPLSEPVRPPKAVKGKTR